MTEVYNHKFRPDHYGKCQSCGEGPHLAPEDETPDPAAKEATPVSLPPFVVLTTISNRRVADLMVTVCEGATTHWCREIDLRSYEADVPDRLGLWYDDERLYAQPFSIDVHVAEETGASVTITRNDFQEALQLMHQQYPQHLADILEENDDAATADIFFQLATFREVVYG